MLSKPLLSLSPVPFWTGFIEHIRVSSMGEIELLKQVINVINCVQTNDE